MPWSFTSMSTQRPSVRARTSMLDPASEYFTAFSSRL